MAYSLVGTLLECKLQGAQGAALNSRTNLARRLKAVGPAQRRITSKCEQRQGRPQIGKSICRISRQASL